MRPLTLRHADLGLGRLVDVGVLSGVVVAGTPSDAEWIDCAGAAVLPGLHDHHVHLLAAAAAVDSLDCEGATVDQFARALRSATPRAGWIRGVGYDEHSVGPLDRTVLDGLRSDVPVRIQHRGGSMWVLNSAALAALHVADARVHGIERDAAGLPTGRLWRLDRWLAERLGRATTPDLHRLSTRMASYGITGVTDATPDLPDETARLLTGGALAQRVTLLGDRAGTAPWKIVVADHDLPELADLCARIAAVRPRPVALHCVTRVGLVLALTALREVGVVRQDRIEHAAVCPPDLAALLAALGVTVVTQPSLVALRGDDYLDRVEPADRDALWPFASLLRAGVRVGCSSDAPYGALDPWRTIAAAARRTTPSGRILGAGERVPTGVALDRFLTPPLDPGGAPRRVRVGAVADLVVLDRPLADALREPDGVRVRHTFVGGHEVFAADTVAA